MTKDLDKLLDECIDRMNKGESLGECLAGYPEQAEELRPLLQAMYNFRDVCSPIPRATARSVVRRRLDAALVNSERSLRKPQRRPMPFFGWSRVLATVSIVLVLALVGFGLNWMLTPGVAPVVAQDNFRLLLSDEENAIGDFQSLEVTITSIGMLRGGEGGGWEVIELEPSVVQDLTPLQGLNAKEIWSGILPEGQYRKAFIYIEDIGGTLKSGGTANMIIPSGNLQISKPFAITTDNPAVDFVYDVTVIEAGKSGQYILLPQANQSGANKSYHEVSEGELTIQVIDPVPPTPVTPGESITILVETLPENPVEGAQVWVNDVLLVDPTGDPITTDGDGEVTFVVPSEEELDEDELEIKAVKDGLEGKLEIDLKRELTLQAKVEEDELIILQVVDADTLVVIDNNDVTSGQDVRVLVTLDGGSPAEGALVTVEDVGDFTTGNNGVTTDPFTVPDDGLEIEAVLGELEGELKIPLEGESEEDELILQVVDADTLVVIENDDVASGQNVRVLVTLDGGSPAEGATVTVEDVGVFTTGNNGVTTDPFYVPFDDELEIEAVWEELEVELDIDLEDAGSTDEDKNVGDTEEDEDVGDTEEDEDVGDTGEDENVGDTEEVEDELTLEVVAGDINPR